MNSYVVFYFSFELTAVLREVYQASFSRRKLLGQTKRFLRGCEDFHPALAELLCLALPGSCLAKHSCLLDQLSIMCPQGGDLQRK